MTRLALAIAVALLVSGAAGSEELAPSITPAELEARLSSSHAPLVLDVRSEAEYAAGHIPGAVNVPFDQVAARAAEIQSPNGIAVYCGVGPRARRGEAALLAAGRESVLHLEGGFTAWQAAGLPVSQP
jgi:rhodanese-related sulfurtransferase